MVQTLSYVCKIGRDFQKVGVAFQIFFHNYALYKLDPPATPQLSFLDQPLGIHGYEKFELFFSAPQCVKLLDLPCGKKTPKYFDE